ncbi:MAG: hypothetical protein K8R92_02660 [Planctomycetes bacterium]|nr:hypothetical protein [Planctomycetota bacterium]
MASRKRSSPKRRAAASRPKFSLNLHWIKSKPFLVAAGWCASFAVMALSLGMGVPILKREAAARRNDAPFLVVFSSRPAWMSETDLTPLADVVAERLNGSPMDRDGLSEAREALMHTGWFSEITQVKRSGMSEVYVEGVWTTPFAVVREGGYDHLIDVDGKLLPRCYRPNTAPSSLIRIENASFARPAAFGDEWAGKDMRGAVALARLIDDHAWRGQIACIDLDRTKDDGCLRMKTNRGCTIKWGRSPGNEGAAEVPARQKIEYLQWLYDHYGRIDAGCDDELNLLSDYVGIR